MSTDIDIPDHPTTIDIPDHPTSEEFEGALAELLTAAMSGSVPLARSWVVDKEGVDGQLMVEITRVAPQTDRAD